MKPARSVHSALIIGPRGPVLIIVVIIGVWTVSVPDCPSGGA